MTEKNVEDIAKAVGSTQTQQCLATAGNTVIENVFENPNKVLVAGTIEQNANAIISNCVNVSTLEGSTLTAQELAYQLGREMGPVNTNSAIGASVVNEVHRIWTTVAVVTACILFVLLVVRTIVAIQKGK